MSGLGQEDAGSKNDLALTTASLKKLVMDNNFESPFKWQFPERNKHQSDWMVKKFAEKLKYMVYDKGVFKWTRYIKLLVLIYEHSQRDENDKSLQYITTCENLLLESQNESDPFFKSIEKALWHVFLATKLVFAKDDTIQQSLLEFATRKITPFDELNNDEKAGILGIKTSVFLSYGPEIGSLMLPTIREAIQLSPNQAEWYYREGCILKRIKRTTDYFSSDRELQLMAFKKAFDLKPNNASYVVKYATELKHVGFKMNQDSNEYQPLWEEVVHLYNKALELRPECPYTIILIVKGFKMFPEGFRDPEKADKLLLEANEKAPTHYLILVELARLYEKKNVHDQACAYYKKAFEEGSYGAVYNYVKTKLKLDPTFNPIPTLESLRDNFYEKNRKVDALLAMGSYYMFFKNDVDSALEKFLEVLKKYPGSNSIKRFKPLCLHVNKDVSLLEFLHNYLNKANKTALKSDEILNEVYQIDPDLRNAPAYHRYWSDAHYNFWSEKWSARSRFEGQCNERRGQCDFSRSSWTNNDDNQAAYSEQGRQNSWRNQTRRDSERSQRDSERSRRDSERTERNWRNTSPPPEGNWRRERRPQ